MEPSSGNCEVDAATAPGECSTDRGGNLGDFQVGGEAGPGDFEVDRGAGLGDF